MKAKLISLLAIIFIGLLFLNNVENLHKLIDSLSNNLAQSQKELANAKDAISALEKQSSDLTISTNSLKDDTLKTGYKISTLEKKDNELSKSLNKNLLLVRKDIVNVKKSFTKDITALHKNILYPSAQVKSKGNIGSGTIIYNKKDANGDYNIYILTVFHVVEKAVSEQNGKEVRDPVTVKIYSEGDYDEYDSELVSYDKKKDVALLKIKTADKLEYSAILASKDEISDMKVFTSVYVVGCPLGHNPTPSIGEISNLNKKIQGEKYWMANAPTIFGNSGGGVFDSKTNKLIGISSMICTYDNLISTPVPHLSVIVSMDTIYDWLDSQYMQFVYDGKVTKEVCDAKREEARKLNPNALKVTWEK